MSLPTNGDPIRVCVLPESLPEYPEVEIQTCAYGSVVKWNGCYGIVIYCSSGLADRGIWFFQDQQTWTPSRVQYVGKPQSILIRLEPVNAH